MGVVLPALGLLLVLLLATVWCWMQWKFRRIISTLSKLPTLTPRWPLLGNLQLTLLGQDWIAHVALKMLQQVGERTEKNVTFWWGPYPYIFIGDGEDVRTVLTSKKCEKSFHYDFFKIYFGNGLLTAPEDIHKITRRHLIPLFKHSNLKRFSSSFNSSSRKLAQAMSEHVGRGSVDVQHMVAFNTSTTIADLLLGPGGYPYESSKLFQQIVPTFKSSAMFVARRMVIPWLWPNAINNFFYGKENRLTLELKGKFFGEICEEKEKIKVEENVYNSKTRSCTEDKDSPTYLTLPEIYEAIQRDYPQFTNNDMEYELATLFMTGSHTMAVYVSSMFVALATYPDIQERLYQEVLSVVGVEDRDVSIEDLKRMPYLEKIIKETTRRFFVVPLIVRKANEDIKLRDVTLPAGTIMAISLVTQLYDSEVYPDPQTFNPERFSSENMAKINKYTFAPFASGSRKCIGYYYAYYLAKLMAVHVIRRFRLTTSMDINNMRLNWDFTACAADGYLVEMHPREPA